MAVHHANIFKSMKDIRFEDTISHQCGITMNDSVEARAIAEVMEKKKGVTVTYMPSMIRIVESGAAAGRSFSQRVNLSRKRID